MFLPFRQAADSLFEDAPHFVGNVVLLQLLSSAFLPEEMDDAELFMVIYNSDRLHLKSLRGTTF